MPKQPKFESPDAETNDLSSRPGLTKYLVELSDLPSYFVPQTGKDRSPGRLVIVGDVHGMKKPLETLLDKVKFDEKHDHLIFAGDMIAKGPDSPGVVDLAMKLGASAVRGNHENKLLRVYEDMISKNIDIEISDTAEDTKKSDDSLKEEGLSQGDYERRKLVRELGAKRIKWLQGRPVILKVGKLEGMGEVVVVHGGLVPGVELEKQDPYAVMNMRSIGKNGVASEDRDGPGWFKVC